MDCQQIAKTIGWLGETWGFWLQTGAFFLSALAAVAVIYHNGAQARVRALIDLIVQQKMDTELIEATRRVYALKSNGSRFTDHLDGNSEERKDILKVLNNQEFIAVGIRMKAFDEKVYKQMQCTNVLRLWEVSQGFIQEIRASDGKKTLFQDFERLACRWEKNPIKKV
jgi:hypothetical protein